MIRRGFLRRSVGVLAGLLGFGALRLTAISPDPPPLVLDCTSWFLPPTLNQWGFMEQIHGGTILFAPHATNADVARMADGLLTRRQQGWLPLTFHCEVRGHRLEWSCINQEICRKV